MLPLGILYKLECLAQIRANVVSAIIRDFVRQVLKMIRPKIFTLVTDTIDNMGYFVLKKSF